MALTRQLPFDMGDGASKPSFMHFEVIQEVSERVRNEHAKVNPVFPKGSEVEQQTTVQVMRSEYFAKDPEMIKRLLHVHRNHLPKTSDSYCDYNRFMDVQNLYTKLILEIVRDVAHVGTGIRCKSFGIVFDIYNGAEIIYQEVNSDVEHRIKIIQPPKYPVSEGT
jgi:hypothetical protein